jgi:hypothetical protein
MNVKVWNTRVQKFQQSQLTSQSALQKNVSSLVKVVNLALIKERELKWGQNGSHSCKPRKRVNIWMPMVCIFRFNCLAAKNMNAL